MFYPKYEHINKRITKYIEKELIEQCIKTGSFIAGGAITSIFKDEPPNDIDIFFQYSDDASFNKFKQWLTDNGLILGESDNAITGQYYKNTVQIIKQSTMFGNPEDLVERFDFTLCMGAYEPKEKKLILDDRFLSDLSARKLIYNPGSIRPLSTLNRLQKFLSRGYTISGIELIKIGLAINNRVISTKRNLRNEILGIDSMFLKNWLDELDNEEEYQYDVEQKRLDSYREND